MSKAKLQEKRLVVVAITPQEATAMLAALGRDVKSDWPARTVARVRPVLQGVLRGYLLSGYARSLRE